MSRTPGAPGHIARNVQVVERLKADLIAGNAALYDALYNNEEGATEDALAAIVTSAFVLSKRLGIPYKELDDAIRRRLRTMIDEDHEVEQWFGDCSALLNYMQDGTG